MTRITVVGSCNIDLVFRTDRLPQMGESKPGLGFELNGGGKGMNQAIAATRLGAETALIAQVGRDNFGDMLLQTLAREGVGCSFVKRSQTHGTGTAAILLDEQGNNAIIFVPRANGELNAKHIRQAESVIARSNLLMLQQEVSAEANLKAARLARANGTVVMLNAAPARPISAEMMALIDVLVVNEIEAEQLSGEKADTVANVAAAAKILHEQGPRIVVVTLGPDGALLFHPENFALAPTHPVDVVDTTGAGDAFCAGLAVALAQGELLLDAVNYANVCGALACTQLGAEPSMPTHGSVMAWLDQFEAEIEMEI